ncbi:MAG: type II CAAX endopeptidase family protein [Firmicutes bacterium]|nr:type II CAAX endopeptidase family protein [Bacillota bacterium]
MLIRQRIGWPLLIVAIILPFLTTFILSIPLEAWLAVHHLTFASPFGLLGALILSETPFLFWGGLFISRNFPHEPLWRAAHPARYWVLGILGGIGLSIVLSAGMTALARWFPQIASNGFSGNISPFVSPVAAHTSASLAVVIIGILIGPLCEEIFFRGFLYTALRTHWSTLWAIMGSAAIFAAYHMEPASFGVLFIVGVVLAYVRSRYSLWASWGTHAGFNAVAFLMLWFMR